MKSIRTKRNTNSSFISNHDLLQNFRNKSFKLITRQPSNTSIKHQVSLLKKKSFQKMQDFNKQNSNFLSNNSILDAHKSKSQLQTIANKINKCDYSVNLYEDNIQTLIAKVVKQLTFVHDQLNSSDFIQLQMILSKNISKLSGTMQKLSQTKRQNAKEQNPDTQITVSMTKKIEEMKNQISKLKKDKLSLKEKIEYLQSKAERQHASSENSQKLKFLSTKNNQNHESKYQQNQNKLEKIIVSQSQIINKQCKNFESQSNQMKYILKAQALKLQEVLLAQDNKKKIKCKSFYDV